MGAWEGLVSAVTSCPRRTSSVATDATWLSTPLTWGWYHGHTWTTRMAADSVDPAAGGDRAAGDRPGPDERLLPHDRADVDRRGNPRLPRVPPACPALAE